jgi:hypothetical protein
VESDVFMLRVEDSILGTSSTRNQKRCALEEEFNGDRTGHWLGRRLEYLKIVIL